MWSTVSLHSFMTVLREPHPGGQTLLKRSPYGEAAVVEVMDELRVNGAAELSHFSVSGSDEDTLNGFHQDVVEQGVLGTWGQSVTNTGQTDTVTEWTGDFRNVFSFWMKMMTSLTS